MMASHPVPNSITNDIVDHLVLSVEDLMKDQKCPAAVCVYRVPKSWRIDSPIAFTPQFVGLGPYYHRLPQLCFNYLKESAVLSVLNNTSVLTKLVKELSNLNHAPLIRNSYDCNLEFKDDTLLYLMTVDALFLYHFLSNFDTKFDPPDGMPRVNTSGVELTKDAIIRDVFMLENQIPIHTLHQIIAVFTSMEAEGPHVHVDEDYLGSKMLHFCRALCPLVNIDKKLCNHVHLLDLMYHLVVSEPDLDDRNVEQDDKEDQYSKAWESILNSIIIACGTESDYFSAIISMFNNHNKAFKASSSRIKNIFYRMTNPNINDEAEAEPEPDENANRGDEDNHKSPHVVEDVMTVICHFPIAICMIAFILVTIVLCFSLLLLYAAFISVYQVFRLNHLLAQLIIRVLIYLVKPIVNLIRHCYPLVLMIHSVLASIPLPFIAPITGVVAQVLCVFGLLVQKSTNSDTGAEILSLKELHQAEINFLPSYGGISSIQFYKGDCIFYLPKIRVDVNSEVIIKNLVAYESLTKSDCLIFTRYVELMRALIKTAEDVKLLVHQKIILTKLNDVEIVQLFNGMRKPIRPTNTPELEDVINKVNHELSSYNSQKLQRFFIKYFYPFLKCIAFVVAIGFWYYLFILVATVSQGKMWDVIKFITSIRIFEWFSLS